MTPITAHAHDIAAQYANGRAHEVKVIESREATETASRPAYTVWVRIIGDRAGRRVASILGDAFHARATV